MLNPTGPVIVLQQNTQRDAGRTAQLSNIQAGKIVADFVRTTLGPKSMLKMLLDPMGGLVITNDGNAILREIDVGHPAAKSMIELSRAQDEEVGDGTTSVVILAGALLELTAELIKKNIHPSLIVSGFLSALTESLEILERNAVVLDLQDRATLVATLNSCLDTKFSESWSQLITKLALDSVSLVTVYQDGKPTEVDVKRFVRVEKIAGGTMEDCEVIHGILLNKDVTHPRMRRYIKNPRIVLLDCPLEYKKGESMTNVEVTQEADWEKLLLQEEAEVKALCQDIINVGCDVVLTEKGVSDLAQHFLMKAGISVIRRVKKTDNNRIARVSGATIVNRSEELCAKDVGTDCGLFRIDKIGDEYYCWLAECKEPKACTVLLRGGSKDVLNEVERNFQDAVNVARNIFLEGKLLPGGGAIEMELSLQLERKAKTLSTLDQWIYESVSKAMLAIPRTLAQNAGANVLRTMTELRARHAQGVVAAGINGRTGAVVENTGALGIWDTFAVKAQTLKTAIECASMIIRVDDIIAGLGKKNGAPDQVMGEDEGAPDGATFGDARDG